VRRFRNPLCLTLAVGLLAGCATLRETGRTPAAGELGGIRVAVFADDDARRAGRIFHGAISGVLEHKEGGRWRPVFRSLDPSWTVASLDPGRYRIRFDGRLDPSGAPEDLERPVARVVDVRRGEMAELELVLDHVSPGMVAAGAVAVVVAAVLLHEWLDDFDLPPPPLPPPHLADVAFWVTLDLADHGHVWRGVDRAPLVTSHFPLEGDLVFARRVRVVFALSEPIEDDRLAPDAVRVETADGRALLGRVSWDARRWWVVWEPLADLPRSTHFVATLDPAAIVDEGGAQLATPASFSFATTP
jgi:hypothetical protein